MDYLKDFSEDERLLFAANDALSISEEFAQLITNALNETHEKQAAIKKQMEGFKLELRKLEGAEDEAYNDLKNKGSSRFVVECGMS